MIEKAIQQIQQIQSAIDQTAATLHQLSGRMAQANIFYEILKNNKIDDEEKLDTLE